MTEKELKAKRKEELIRAYLNSILRETFFGISQLNEEAAETILKNTSKACANAALAFMAHNYGYDPRRADFDAFLIAEEKMQKQLAQGQASVTREGNIITEVVRCGECVCPLVKDYKIIQPFPNLCLCAKNHFKALYEAGAKRPVKVEMIETYNRSGKSDIIKIKLL